MSSTRTVRTRQGLKAEDWDTLSLDDLLSKNGRERGGTQKITSDKPAGPKDRDQAIL